MQTQKYAYIDTLRGFAIMGVVAVHTAEWVAPKSDLLSKMVAQGARGVQLFYIASALTLFLSLASKMESESRPVLSFYLRRFFRIAPAFYLAIIAYIVYYGFSARYWAPNGIQWWYVPLTALFLNGWHPETITSIVPGGWSIAVEVTFYLCVPILFLMLSNIRRSIVALFISLIFASISAFVVGRLLTPHYPANQQYLVGNFTFLWFFSQLPVFILGIVLYHVTRIYPRQDKGLATLLLISSLFLFVAFLTTDSFLNLLPQHFLYGLAFLLFSLSLFYWQRVFLVNAFTVWVGKLSFSIYLTHVLVINFLGSVLPRWLPGSGNRGFAVAVILVLAASMSVSYLSYKLIETPGIGLGRRVVNRLQASRSSGDPDLHRSTIGGIG